MLLRIILIFLTFSLSISSAPTNCKTCRGHFLLFHELKTNEEKLKSLQDFCSHSEYIYFPFEYGILDWVEKDGINSVLEEMNKCTSNACIRELCSKLSNRTCIDI